MFLVSGAEKAEALREVLQGELSARQISLLKK